MAGAGLPAGAGDADCFRAIRYRRIGRGAGRRMDFHRGKRREVLRGGAAVAASCASCCVLWPPAARAQRQTMPVIGYFSGRSAGTDQPMLTAFRRGLDETGYTEGRNVAIEF